MEVNRELNFDWVRGCMVLWMLTYHISLNYGIITYGVAEPSSPTIFTFMSFFMASFYVSSGYFFSTKLDVKDFVQNKTIKILIPYCAFYLWGAIIYEANYIVTNGHIGGFGIMLPSWVSCCSPTNTPLWFIYSLFMCNVIYYIINKIIQREYIIHIIIILCFALAFMTQNKLQILGYGNILLGMTFIHFGNYLGKYKKELMGKHWAILAILIYLTIGILIPERLEFDRNVFVQGHYMLWFVFSVAACFSLWYISRMWQHDNAIGHALISIGQTSLVIFASHRPVLNWIIEPLIRKIYPSVSYFVFWLISIICILLISYGINYLLEKYCPLLIGKRK